MSWKEWPAWVKGGIMSVILFSLAILTVYIFYHPQVICDLGEECPIAENSALILFIHRFMGYIAVPFMSFLELVGLSNNSTPLWIIMILIYFFAIGAGMSWIISRVKGKIREKGR